MINDENRREVAAIIRDMFKYECKYKVEFFDLLRDALDQEFDIVPGFDNMAEILADLIDRPTTTVTVASGDDDSDLCIKCNSCCRGWHISKYDKSFTYCPECGAEVVE